MKNFSLEPIVLLVIFILIPLANYVLERMRRRFHPPSSARQPMPDMGMRRQAAPESMPESAAYTERAKAPPPTRTVTPSSRRWSRKALFRTRRDVRRTIVAMTILSPCRAYDPPD
jgi:hypothetical protein